MTMTCTLCHEDVERKIQTFVKTIDEDALDALFHKVKTRCHWCPMDVFGSIRQHTTDEEAILELETLMTEIRNGDVHIDRRRDYWPYLYLALEDRVHERIGCREVLLRIWRRFLEMC